MSRTALNWEKHRQARKLAAAYASPSLHYCPNCHAEFKSLGSLRIHKGSHKVVNKPRVLSVEEVRERLLRRVK